MSEQQPTVVVGIDGTEAGQRALAWAIKEASAHDATLRVVHAWTFEPLSDFAFTSSRQVHTESVQLLEKEVAQATEGKENLPRIVTESLQGDAAGSLLHSAQDAILLVVGSHKGGLLREITLGSVSGSCVRHATCPVVVVPPPRKAVKDTATLSQFAPPGY